MYSEEDGGKRVFKLGLALAGAATGGAFEAGVMDFLLEALGQWELEKERYPGTTPPWEVEVTDIVGTSAGGITSTLAVAAINSGCTPLPKDYKLGDPAPKHNPLFRTWVKEMDHTRLFDTADLHGDDDGAVRVRSILNADFMKDTAHAVLADHGDITPLPNYARNLMLSLTSTNLTGVPYSVKDFQSKSRAREFFMRQHGDWTSFQLHNRGDNDKSEKYPYPLNAENDRTGHHWEMAIESSRATAAFPVGFPAVNVRKPLEAYESRQRVQPEWPKDTPKVLQYANLDGGVVNNDPFQLTVDLMERHGDGSGLKSSAKKAWGAVVLVDPFPSQNQEIKSVTEELTIVESLEHLLTAMRGQAMFKQQCLESNPDAMDRFLLHPVRKMAQGQEFKIATATMGSFGGMIDEKIRLHDFMLGRQNCQDFLQNVLVMDKEDMEDNPIFEALDSYGEKIPIVPLYGTAQKPCPKPEWPKYTPQESKDVIDGVTESARVRFDRIVDLYLIQIGVGWVARWAVKDYIVRAILRRVKGSVEIAMKQFV